MGTIVSKPTRETKYAQQSSQSATASSVSRHNQHDQKRTEDAALHPGEKRLRPIETLSNKEVIIIDGTAYHRSMVPEGLVDTYLERYREQQFRLKQHAKRGKAERPQPAQYYKADQVQNFNTQDEDHEPEYTTTSTTAVMSSSVPGPPPVKRKESKRQVTSHNSSIVIPQNKGLELNKDRAADSEALGIVDSDHDSNSDQEQDQENASHPSTPQGITADPDFFDSDQS